MSQISNIVKMYKLYSDFFAAPFLRPQTFAEVFGEKKSIREFNEGLLDALFYVKNEGEEKGRVSFNQSLNLKRQQCYKNAVLSLVDDNSDVLLTQLLESLPKLTKFLDSHMIELINLGNKWNKAIGNPSVSEAELDEILGESIEEESIEVETSESEEEEVEIISEENDIRLNEEFLDEIIHMRGQTNDFLMQIVLEDIDARDVANLDIGFVANLPDATLISLIKSILKPDFGGPFGEYLDYPPADFAQIVRDHLTDLVKELVDKQIQDQEKKNKKNPNFGFDFLGKKSTGKQGNPKNDTLPHSSTNKKISNGYFA